MQHRQCDQTWRNFGTLTKNNNYLGQLLKALFTIWQIFDAIGQIYMPINGHILKNTLANWVTLGIDIGVSTLFGTCQVNKFEAAKILN